MKFGFNNQSRILYSERQAVKSLLIFTLILTSLRIILLFNNGMPLYADEAQYWVWSQNLEFGYYSKPPMIAGVIAFSTWLFGNGEAGVRFLSPIIHMFTCLAVFALARRLFDFKVAVLSAFIFITLPSIFLSSMLISTDVPLLLIWALTLHAIHIAIDRNLLKNWCIVGFLTGLGLMTKYHFAIIFPATIIYCMQINKLKIVLSSPGPYIGTMIAALIFAPNMYWNFQNDFVSLVHTADLAGAKSTFSMRTAVLSLAKFLLDQFAVFSPFLLIFTIVGLIKNQRNTDAIKFLSTYMFSFIIVIALLAIKNKAHANWTAPGYISGCILSSYFFVHLHKINWFKYNIIAQCLFGLIVMFAPFIMMNMHDLKSNPFNRITGFELLAKEVSQLKLAHPNAIFATDDRKSYALMVYYTKPHLFELKKFNELNHISDHFDLTSPFSNPNKADVIIVSKYASLVSLRHYFTNSQISQIAIDDSLNYNAYLIKP